MPASSAPAPTRPEQVAARRLDGLAAFLGTPLVPDAAGVMITGITHASAEVRPGDVYAALPGRRTHGARYAQTAGRSGAVALLTDDQGAHIGAEAGLPTLVAADPRALLGDAAAYVYGFPAADLTLLGVTGTNGKTTVTSLLHAVLSATSGPAGLVGTIETRVGELAMPSVRTTPEACDLHGLLAAMRERGVTTCAIEVSSHALALGRVGGLVVDVAGFTNLSQDHLDFHTDMEDYFAAKAALFTPRHARRGVVMVDDRWGRRLLDEAGIPVVTVAAVPDDPRHRHVRAADWRLSDITSHPEGGRAVLSGPDGERLDLRVPLPGLVNVANAALTVALAVEAGVEAHGAVEALARAPMVPGRMELVSGSSRPAVVVDYAHSPDALERALHALRSGATAPLVVVVGAGGDRDTSKRGPMGEVAARGADLVIVTDDNPRSEDPAAIRAAVLAGARRVDPDRVREVADRGSAIRAAIEAAGTGTVLVAGKGHEQGQEVAGTIHPFDDRAAARAALAEGTSRAGTGT